MFNGNLIARASTIFRAARNIIDVLCVCECVAKNERDFYITRLHAYEGYIIITITQNKKRYCLQPNRLGA